MSQGFLGQWFAAGPAEHAGTSTQPGRWTDHTQSPPLSSRRGTDEMKSKSKSPSQSQSQSRKTVQNNNPNHHNNISRPSSSSTSFSSAVAVTSTAAPTPASSHSLTSPSPSPQPTTPVDHVGLTDRTNSPCLSSKAIRIPGPPNDCNSYSASPGPANDFEFEFLAPCDDHNFSNGVDVDMTTGPTLDSAIGRSRQDSFVSAGPKPISMINPNRENANRGRRESLAGSLMNGMSWGGLSVGSFIRDE